MDRPVVVLSDPIFDFVPPPPIVFLDPVPTDLIILPPTVLAEPFSEELVEVVEEDVVFGRLSAEQRRRADGVPFVIYKPLHHDHDEKSRLLVGSLRIKAALAAMQNHSATVLELAATIHWLAFVEQVESWRIELVRRKGVKTEQGRMDEALNLLQEIGLAPAVAPA